MTRESSGALPAPQARPPHGVEASSSRCLLRSEPCAGARYLHRVLPAGLLVLLPSLRGHLLGGETSPAVLAGRLEQETLGVRVLVDADAVGVEQADAREVGAAGAARVDGRHDVRSSRSRIVRSSRAVR